jgi:hypothetical protein
LEIENLRNHREEIKTIFENYEDAVKEALRNLSERQLVRIGRMIGIEPVRSEGEFFYNDTVEDIEQELFGLSDEGWSRMTLEIFKLSIYNRRKKNY